jgi:hypothetical protein
MCSFKGGGVARGNVFEDVIITKDPAKDSCLFVEDPIESESKGQI